MHKQVHYKIFETALAPDIQKFVNYLEKDWAILDSVDEKQESNVYVSNGRDWKASLNMPCIFCLHLPVSDNPRSETDRVMAFVLQKATDPLCVDML